MVQQADVVGHRARGVDVVRDDEEGRLDLRVEVDDELVEVGRAHQVEAGVGLVEEDDLRVEHQARAEPALAHAAGDLAGQLALGALQADQLDLLDDDARTSDSLLRVCSRSGKAMLS